jgi:hypothetical protein
VLGSVEFLNGLLRSLEVGLNLSLCLLDVGADLLLAVKVLLELK